MRIGWVTEASPKAVPSTADAYQQTAPEGLELVLCSSQSFEVELDAYMVFDPSGLGVQLLEHIASKKYVMIPQGWWLNYEANAQYRDPLFANAAATVFLSPLHQRHWLDLHSNVVPERGYIVPPPIDPLAVYLVEERNEDCFWAQDWHPYNGPDLAASWAERAGLKLDMYSPSMPQDFLQAGTHFNKTTRVRPWPVAPEHMFAEYKRYIHLNRYPDPFGYRIAMAHESGVEAIVSGHVGIESFGLPIERVIELCKDSTNTFWSLMEKVLP